MITPWTLLLLAFIIGLIFGSFFSMLSWRLPRNLIADHEGTPPELWSLKTRSICPKCHTALPWTRLIPLFSWLASRGQCHACKAPISYRYPLIELSTATLTVLAVWMFGLSFKGLAVILFSWLVLLLVVIDLEHKLLPDVLTFPLMWLGLLINSTGGFVAPQEAIWGAAAGYLILWSTYWAFKLLTGKEGMGYGDFKMMAAMGAWFGLQALPALLLLSALSGIVVQLIMRLFGRGETQFAFGPYIALAGLVWLYGGEQLMQWGM